MAQHQQPTEGSDHAAPHSEATSRLCVKNVPKYLDEKRLKEHFSAKGQVTDVKVLKTRDGHSRQMAFVGYRSIEDATTAIKYFQNTYIDTSKLSIEFARRYRAPTAAAADASAAAAIAAAADKEHRPWSKYSVGSSKHQQMLQKAAAAAAAATDGKVEGKVDRLKKKKKGAAAAAGDGDAAAAADSKLAEFLQLMQPRTKAKIWSNDDVLPSAAAVVAAATAAGGKGSAGMALDADDEADELYVDLANGKQQQQQQKSAAAAAVGSGQSGSDDEDTDDDSSDPLATKDAVVVDEKISDLEYLKARMRSAGQQQQQHGSSSSSSDLEDDDHDAAAAASSSDESESDDDLDHDQAAGSDDGISDQSAGVVNMLEPDQQQQQQQSDDPAAAGDHDDDDDHGHDRDHDHNYTDQDGNEFDAAARGDQAGVGPSAAEAAAAAGSAAEAEILETGRLFVRNLAFSAGEAELSELFGGFGTLEEVHVVLDRDTKRSKGIAYIKYLLPEDAVEAYRALDMNPFQGRLLHVLPAKKKPGDGTTDSAAAAADMQRDEAGVGGSSSFKTQRNAQRRSDAGNRAAWSSLFMRPDTVAAAVAAHYGVSKSQLLDAAASDLPLRMALGEVQVIAQTKAALADGGINVAALEAAAAAAGAAAAKKSVTRSGTTLLIKNLPYAAEEDELRQLLSGANRTVVRMVLPPTKTLALVEFAEPQEARSAFKSLAYKKYKQVPLYLEWAPKDIWDTPPPTSPAAAAAAGGGGKPEPTAAVVANAAAVGDAAAGKQAAAADSGAGEDEGAERAVGWVYVKNLNFSTTDAALKKHFDKAVSAAGGVIHSAKVARRKGPDGKVLSMGFGFVETDSEAAAKAAIQALQGSMLDKHKVQLQLSKHGASGGSAAAAAAKASKAAKSAAGKEAGMKLVVRNVAFEATRKDVMGLFGPFGHIKSCRLPKKFDGNHRGFAFLEFTTKQEATNALEGVGGTHLYGRRLVVEYAQADEEGAAKLDDLRAKTAARFAGGDEEAEAPAPKRLKRNL